MGKSWSLVGCPNWSLDLIIFGIIHSGGQWQKHTISFPCLLAAGQQGRITNQTRDPKNRAELTGSETS